MKKYFQIALLLILLLVSCAPAGAENSFRKPNIIFILTDDMRYDEAEFMPVLQKGLVDEGVSLSNFFVNVPNCCPSRATILLGQYSHNTRIINNGGRYGGSNSFSMRGLEAKTFALSLQEAGYFTAYAGRYLNGFPGILKKGYVPAGWDKWLYALGTPQIKKTVIEQLTDALESDRPFFFHIAPVDPHYGLSDAGEKIPPKVEAQYRDLFLGERLPVSPAFNEPDVSDKPAQIALAPRLSADEEAAVLDHYQKRLQSLQAVDDILGTVLSLLEEYGQLETTYIFFSSDNGFLLGEHRIVLDKHAPYEEAVRVPLIVRGPGIPHGLIVSSLSGNVDLAVTFAEIGGASLKSETDGVSLLPILKGDSIKCRDAYLLQYWFHKDRALFPSMGFALDANDPVSSDENFEDLEAVGSKLVFYTFRGLRTLDFKYIEYVNGDQELYLLDSDPYELDNRINDASPELLEILHDWVGRLSTCKGVSCREAEKTPILYNISMLPE